MQRAGGTNNEYYVMVSAAADLGVRQRKQALRRAYSPRSAARCCSIQAPPALSFFANGDFGSTTRQNGATSLVGTPDSISSQAASATVRRKIAVDTGHVASAPWSLASSRLICCTSRVSPDGTCCLKYCSTSTGQEIRSFAPAGTPAKSFSRVTVWGGFAAIFCFQLLGLLGIVRSFADIVHLTAAAPNNPRKNPDALPSAA